MNKTRLPKNNKRQAVCEHTPRPKFTHSFTEFYHCTGKRQSCCSFEDSRSLTQTASMFLFTSPRRFFFYTYKHLHPLSSASFTSIENTTNQAWTRTPAALNASTLLRPSGANCLMTLGLFFCANRLHQAAAPLRSEQCFSHLLWTCCPLTLRQPLRS